MDAPNSTSFSVMNDSAPVAFFDSGIGGLPYLEWAKNNMPLESFVYLLDRKNFPYGTKSPEEVFRAVEEGIGKLIAAVKPKIIILACNTASVVALERLRKKYPEIPFVGVVPAVKPAAERTRGKKIGVMATNRTLQDKYLDDLIHKFANDCEVVRVAGPLIVDFVEKKLFTSTSEERRAIIKDAAQVLRARNVDELVLGCTHFLYVADELQQELGKDIEIIDSRTGVGRQIIKILASRRAVKKVGNDRLFLTGSEAPEKQYLSFADRFGLEVAGTL